MVAAQGRREAGRNHCFVGTVSVVHTEKVLEEDRGDGCDNGHVLNTTGRLNTFKMVNFRFCVFSLTF